MGVVIFIGNEGREWREVKTVDKRARRKEIGSRVKRKKIGQTGLQAEKESREAREEGE